MCPFSGGIKNEPVCLFQRMLGTRVVPEWHFPAARPQTNDVYFYQLLSSSPMGYDSFFFSSLPFWGLWYVIYIVYCPDNLKQPVITSISK